MNLESCINSVEQAYKNNDTLTALFFLFDIDSYLSKNHLTLINKYLSLKLKVYSSAMKETLEYLHSSFIDKNYKLLQKPLKDEKAYASDITALINRVNYEDTL